MEHLGKIALNSSWETSEDLRSLLSVSISSGEYPVEDIPFDSNNNSSITLNQPTIDQPCYIDISNLHGSEITRLELISGSRIVEVYTSNGEEYVTTCRGTHLERLTDGNSMYSCDVAIPPTSLVSEVSVKLLSLKGRSNVLVKKIHLSIATDRKESTSDATTEAEASVDIQQLLDSASLQSAPPFMKLLLSSLQSYSSNLPSSPQSTTITPHRNTMPPELSQMMSAFKQLRPTTTNGVNELERPNATSKEETDESRMEVNEKVLSLVECKLSEMETRILEYVDAKFVDLQHQVDIMLRKISNLDTRLSSKPRMPHNGSMCTQVMDDEHLD